MIKTILPPVCIAVLGFSVQTGSAQIVRSFTEPIEKRLVAATQPDVVAKLLAEEGGQVESGAVLAELDNSVLMMKLKIARIRAESNAAIDSAEIANNTNRQRMLRLRQMLENGHANPSEIEKAEADFKATTAELQLAKEKQKEFRLEVERIQAEIERNIIRSPIAGVVTEIHCRPGEFISSQERKLATVVNIEKLRVRFYLLEDQTKKLKANDLVVLGMGESRTKVNALVEYVSPVIAADSGTSRVEVVIDNQDRRFRSGSVCYWMVGTQQDDANQLNGRELGQ